VQDTPLPVEVYPGMHVHSSESVENAVKAISHVHLLRVVLTEGEDAPTGHKVHAIAPISALYVPSRQEEHATPISVEVYPGMHAHSKSVDKAVKAILQVQSLRVVLAEGEDAPGGQEVHALAPSSALYVSTGHEVHATPLEVAVYPGLHKHSSEFVDGMLNACSQTQLLRTVLAEGDDDAGGHKVHAIAPISALYVFAKHEVHATPSDVAVYPGTHLQSVNSLLCTAELVRAGHAVHVLPPKVL
jgi:hypothetical protein